MSSAMCVRACVHVYASVSSRFYFILLCNAEKRILVLYKDVKATGTGSIAYHHRPY